MKFKFCPMDAAAVRQVITWRYEAPYDIYNLNFRDLDDARRCFLDPQNAYQRVVDGKGGLVAFCCYGPDAQVPGGDYAAPGLDIGLGVRPDLTGQGRGLAFVQAVLDYAEDQGLGAPFRVTIAEFNQRAQRVWEKAGFRQVQAFKRAGDGAPFVVLTREE